MLSDYSLLIFFFKRTSALLNFSTSGRPAGMMTVSNRPDVTGVALLTVASKFGNALSYLFWKGERWIKIEVLRSNYSVVFVTKLTSGKQTCAHS